MKIKSIGLENFRNYEKLELEFDESRNILVGENAQGKTNLVEAIYLTSFAKSFRTNNAADLVKFGENLANVRVNVESEDINKEILIVLRNDGKKMVKKDGKIIKKTADLLNNVVVVAFSPEDLRIIKDNPEKRRDFLNRELSQIRPRYYEQLRAYNNVLKQKNSLLKNFVNDHSKTFNEDMLDVYDKQLADAAYEIIRYRKEFVEMLSNEAGEIVSAISGGKDNLLIEYKTACDYVTSPEGREILYKQFRSNREKDMYTGNMSLGPHRDDLEFSINGVDAKKYGSQGQQRTIALSLKLAEIRIAKNLIGEYPILLLDDVLSELDVDRQKYLVNQIEGVQLFITSAEINDAVISSLQGRLFEIEGGEIKQCTDRGTN